MKKLIFLMAIVLPLYVTGQEKIYQAKELKRGIYKTYEEFINNSPSITNEFSVKEKNTVRGGSPFDFEISDGTKVGKVFGFCDGKYVYMKGLRMGGFCKVDYVGRYSFFNYGTHGVGVAAMAVPGHLVIVDDGGKYRDGTVNFVSKFIRSSNPTLADEFDKLTDKKAKREEYLIKLNESLKNQ
ncbi:MAG: hypothetical protein HYZ44_04130 [Bacteroidetes bacterium]|nr:hypothetical protein [Bacteroidota bacterium]